jgi:hypothetical protein
MMRTTITFPLTVWLLPYVVIVSRDASLVRGCAKILDERVGAPAWILRVVALPF